MVTKSIVIRITGNVAEKAEDIITTEWAKYNERFNHTTIKIPGERDFQQTATEVYKQLGEITDWQYYK